MGNPAEPSVVVGAARADEAVTDSQLCTASVIRQGVVGMEAFDAAETAFHQVGKQIVAVQLAGMREHRQPAVLHDGPHGVARVHVVDIAVADAAVLEQAAVPVSYTHLTLPTIA